MKTTLIAVENDADHVEAKALVGKLTGSRKSDDRVRLVAQARLIEAYEPGRWPRSASTLPDLLNYFMDQRDLSRSDLVPMLGTVSRVSEVMNGKRELSMNMVRRLRERINISAGREGGCRARPGQSPWHFGAIVDESTVDLVPCREASQGGADAYDACVSLA